MSGEWAPAALAAGGGTALLGGIAAYEYGRERQMRASRRWLAIRFPAGITAEAGVAALASLSGLSSEQELVFEVRADDAGISHRLLASAEVADSAAGALSSSIRALRLDEDEGDDGAGSVSVAVRLSVSRLVLLQTGNAEGSSRALLSVLAALRRDERVIVRWALRPGSPAPTVNGRDGAVVPKGLAARQSEPGFGVNGLLMVRAQTRQRAEVLRRHVEAVLRSRRRTGAGVLLRAGRVRSDRSLPSTYRRRGWLSAAEVLPLLAWPLGDEQIPGLEVGVSRQLLVPRGVARKGRELFIGRDVYGERPVALTAEASLRHVAVVGPSGVGKSVLLARTAVAAIAAGTPVILLDPKADLARDVLEQVPADRAEDVVVLDPSLGEPVPGLDLFAAGDPDLRADVILGALRAIYREHWGTRTEAYFRLGLRTLSEQPNPALTDWMRLFSDPAFRRQAVGRLRDPLLRLEWARFEALSTAEQAQHIQAPMSRLLALLARPALRDVLAQESPKLDFPRLLAERKSLLVNLSPGTLGEPASRLLGAVLVYCVWSAIEQRAALAAEQRFPAALIVDELQTLQDLPFGLEYLFERARGLGCGVTVATQALGRLPESLRRSLLGNVGTLISFRLGFDEASRIARELPGITAGDLQALAPFEVAAKVSRGAGSGIAVVTGRSQPPLEPTGQADRIRALTVERYGGRAADPVPPPARPEAGEDEIGRARRGQ